MLCSFKRLIYPKNPDMSSNGFMIGIYNVHEKMLDAYGKLIAEAKVVGYLLPLGNNIRFKMNGHWAKTDKHGTQFEMESYQEAIRTDKAGIVAYLSSGMIKGIGPKIAERIYDEFGDQTLDILDQIPDKLRCIPGISSRKLEKICDSYLASRGARDIVTMLAPHGITPNKAAKIYREFGVNTITILRENPYKLCEIDGIGFLTADKIAINMGLSQTSPIRIDAGLLQTLKETETQGNLCMEKSQFLKECVKLLDTEGVDAKLTSERAFAMLRKNELVLYNDLVYRPPAARAETIVADNVNILMSYGSIKYDRDMDIEINIEERKLGLKLVAEQREAIKSCLSSRICIITGGPGTGKTLIQRVLLSIYTKLNPKAKVVFAARLPVVQRDVWNNARAFRHQRFTKRSVS